jgi:rod shape-determining protein MreD
VIRNTVRFAFVFLIQLLILNNIQFSGYVNPFFYLIFILLLPFETPPWLVLILGFISGLTMDFFEGTLGIHASAGLVAGLIRPFVLQVIAPRDGYEQGTLPRLSYYGFGWFLQYTLILVFVHHFWLFYMEVFRFTDFFNTLLRVLLSTVFSVFFIVISQFLIFRK